jgi:hypothetical protein
MGFSLLVEDAKSEGLVKAALERAGIRGAVVAPSVLPHGE